MWNQMIFKVPYNANHSMTLKKMWHGQVWLALLLLIGKTFQKKGLVTLAKHS